MQDLWAIKLVRKVDGERDRIERVTYTDSDNDIPECVKHMTQLFGSELQNKDNYCLVIERNKSNMQELFG